ncbi:MAG: AAA family ATPase, partial [Mycobacterium sp.]
MRLHRLALTNYRGITHREIDFPDHGVTVVHGVNEAGKSSMIEALDLLLESKDRSTKKDVKQVKPTHADVGSEVTAEISTGPYRFVYRKRFHKKCETELTVLAPRREQLTGDEAHERVRAILDETVDTGLWQAQRVLQSAPTAAINVSGSDALSRALDIAAGDAAGAGLSGVEPVLIEKIEAEYSRYFTATGRPTGEWAAATKALATAEETVARCAEALAEVEEKTRLHAQLTADLAEVATLVDPAAQRCAAAEAAYARMVELRTQLRTAGVQLDAAKATESAAAAAQRERLRLRADLDARSAAVTAAAEAAAAAVAAEADGTA